MAQSPIGPDTQVSLQIHAMSPYGLLASPWIKCTSSKFGFQGKEPCDSKVVEQMDKWWSNIGGTRFNGSLKQVVIDMRAVKISVKWNPPAAAKV